MVHDPRVSHALSRLGGVYRDPNRVDRDAASLLKSSVGAHLVPIISEMVENNGTSSHVLVLQGTIAMHFRGNTYQQLVDVYLPAGYPNTPPVCFVRLANPNMYLKENHRHVGSDGKVYLPYLHEWNRQTHNLVECVVAMSSVFSADPPVFTRAATVNTAYTAHASTTSTVATAHPPPAAVTTTTTTSTSGNRSGWRDSSVDSEREAIMAVEIAQANEAAEAARKAELAEQERQKQAERDRQLELQEQQRRQRQLAEQEDRQKQRHKQLVQACDSKLRSYLLQQMQECQEQVSADARDAQRLVLAQQKIKHQQDQLEKRVSTLQAHVAIVDERLVDIQQWLSEQPQQETTTMNGNDGHQEQERSIDDMVEPATALHGQMMSLASENQALSDTLYLVDRALYKGHLDAISHLYQVRKLAKQQFLVRAHLLKIQQHAVIANSSYSSI